MRYLRYAALVLLLVTGLVNLFPATLTPLLELGTGFLTLQRIFGFVSVILAGVLFFVPEGKE